METTAIIAIISAGSGILLSLAQGFFKTSEKRFDENSKMRQELRESNAAKDKEIDVLRQKLDLVSSQYYELRDAKTKTDAALQRMTEEYNELKGDYAELKAENVELKKRVSDLESRK